MQGRSRMAAWMLVATATGVVGLASPTIAAGPTSVKQKVTLKIRIDGVKSDGGAEVVIQPGHPASRFKPITYPVRRDGVIPDTLPIDVETFSADRDCSFAIVLKEPGQPDKVFRRSLRIVPSPEATPGKPQVLECSLSQRDISSKAYPIASKRVASKPTPDTARKR